MVCCVDCECLTFCCVDSDALVVATAPGIKKAVDAAAKQSVKAAFSGVVTKKAAKWADDEVLLRCCHSANLLLRPCV